MLEALQASFAGKLLCTFLISMVPVIELRGGLPFGIALGLPYPAALAAAVIGNCIPVPFIILFVKKVFLWMKNHGILSGMVEWLEKKGMSKTDQILRYEAIGLMILVAIPLPGTGAWTGSLAAALLDMPLKKAVPPVIAGVFIAAAIVSVVTYGVIAFI